MAYATVEQFHELTAFNEEVIAADAEIEHVLDRASRDLDAYLAWPAPLNDVLRIEVGLLTPYQRACLARATVEQATYRLMRGEAEMAVDQDGVASVEGIGFASQPPPRIAPQAQEALADAGLFLRSGTVAVEVDEVV